MKGIELCAECAYYNMKSHKCTRDCKIDPDSEKGEDVRFFVDCPLPDVQPVKYGKWEEIHISLVKYIPEDEKEEGHSFYMAEMKCSCCERYNTVTFALTLNKPDFCQLCGARMIKDGDAE